MNFYKLRKNVILFITLAAVLIPCFLFGCTAKPELTAPPDNLTLNLMPEPLGVSLNSLRFGWKMNDPDDNEKQTAYRVVLAKTRDDFNSGVYVYDSDWITSSQSTCVRLKDVNNYLKVNSLYYWAVATKDKDGNISDFSELQAFTTEMSAAWESTDGIWAAEPYEKSDDSFVFLRSRFEAKRFSEIEKVTVSVTATDTESARQYVYNLFVNGICVGLGPCRTGIDENGEEVLYYNTYDITQYLFPDVNVISAINYADEGRSFLCQITAFYSDGSSDVLLNSGRDYASWKSLPADLIFGKSNSIGTGYYTAYANNIDANIYPFGFSEVEFDDGDWNGCYDCGSINGDRLLKNGEYYPLKRFERSGAVVSKLANGDYIVDLKQEIVGGIKIVLNGAAGDNVNLYYGEQLNSDGSVKWQMNTGNNYCEVFKLKEGKQTIETIDMLTYRYVQISGYNKVLRADAVHGLEIRAEFNDNDAVFSSNSQLLNDIFALTEKTIKYTTQDIMVDSQSRERRCYEGDLLINALASYAVSSNLCSARLSLEYILTHRTAFEDYGLISVIVAKQDYLYTGDDEVLRNYYNVLKEHCYALPVDSVTHLVITEDEGNLVIDWPENDRDGYEMSVKYNTALNCIQYRTYRDFAYIAKVLGKFTDYEEATARADLLKRSITDNFYDVDKGAFCDGIEADGSKSRHFSQQASAYALWSGICEGGVLTKLNLSLIMYQKITK